jgi:hypothetical protein
MSEQVTTSPVGTNNNVTTVIVDHQVRRPEKSLLAAYILLILLGPLGIHQFYLGKHGRGLLYLLTFGVATLACWWDIFTLPAQTRQVNTQRAVGTR